MKPDKKVARICAHSGKAVKVKKQLKRERVCIA
jgi:hypothetical protein